MDVNRKCSCGCGSMSKSVREYHVGNGELSLADLPIGRSAKVAKLIPNLRSIKKFADIGIIAGTEMAMEAHAPFGGLLRVRFMGTSMALHRDDAENIILEPLESL